MKNIFTLLLTTCLFIYTVKAQGKYAGAMKKLVGKTYNTDAKDLPVLKGWQFREGSVVNPLDDIEMMTVDVYQKGTTCVVFFSIEDDTSSHTYRIMDVLEVKNVMKGWQIRTTFCRKNKEENVEIVALVKSVTTEFMKTVKQAWRFNRDKRRFELLSIKGIDCISEGGD